MSELAIEVEGVVKRFGALRALDGVDLRVRRGEVYGLLGPNGSGKTTLIRCLVGLVRPDAGRVVVLGRRIPDLAVLGRVGYMTQAAALYPDLSVAENLRFFAAISGARDGIDHALEFVDLTDRRDSVVATLSGGMRTRASLACALVHRPDLLLLDEPTVGVDPQLRVQLWDRFRSLTAAGASIVVSSHVMDEAERCDRLGLIRAGRLLAEGTADELRRRAGSDRLEDAFLRLSGAEAPA
ncbi:MAG TPA: ABC transporter ATP-binding protein [Candidatus Dormibacteraeota bacterium]|nr:ABC transporter ATP-binding protein [Candidatus Dormibacteraeota bacterium]